MVWMLFLFALYVLIGFFFKKPRNWKLREKIIVHLLWLPTVIIIVSVFLFGNKENQL